MDTNFESYWSHRSDNPLNDLESLSIDRDGCITSIGQPIDSIDNLDGQYIGLTKISKSFIETIKTEFVQIKKLGNFRDKNFEDAYMTDFLQHLIDVRIKINACKINSDWLEIDTVADLINPVSVSRARRISAQIQ